MQQFYDDSFASVSSLFGDEFRRLAHSAHAVTAPPMVSPTKSPFIIAAVTTADASTIFTEVPPNQFAYGTAPSHPRFPGRVLPATDAVNDAVTDERITKSGRSRSLRPQPVKRLHPTSAPKGARP